MRNDEKAAIQLRKKPFRSARPQMFRCRIRLDDFSVDRGASPDDHSAARIVVPTAIKNMIDDYLKALIRGSLNSCAKEGMVKRSRANRRIGE